MTGTRYVSGYVLRTWLRFLRGCVAMYWAALLTALARLYLPLAMAAAGMRAVT